MNNPRGSRHRHDSVLVHTICAKVMKNSHYGLLLCFVLYLSSFSQFQSQQRHMAVVDHEPTRLVAASDVVDIPEFETTTSVDDASSSSSSSSLPKSTLSEFETYKPSHDPVLSTYKPSSKKPVQVHIMTGSLVEVRTQTKFLMEGIERSEYLRLVSISFLEQGNTVKVLEINAVDYKAPMIWMVDVWAIDHDCHALEVLVRHAKTFDQKKIKKQPQHRPHLVLVDYSGSPQLLPCLSVLNDWMAESTNVRIAQRGIVLDRQWNPKTQWVKMGKIAPNIGKKVSAGNILHTPYPLREAVLWEVTKFVEDMKISLKVSKLRPADIKRSTDVVMFWRKGDNAHYANLRREAASVVNDLQGFMIGDNYKLHTLVRLFADLESMEKNVVHGRYIQEMMGTKAIVVAQRDEWEDHYRLMESLSSGALVLTDTMLGLPEGLQHGKNIIVYDSAASLKEYLIYYLNPDNDRERIQIAKKGWELVLGHHRCWHRVEELIFGEALTAVDHAYDTKIPPRRPRTKSNPNEAVQLIEVAVKDNLTLSFGDDISDDKGKS